MKRVKSADVESSGVLDELVAGSGDLHALKVEGVAQ